MDANNKSTTGAHVCDECGLDRTEIIARECGSCTDFVEGLDVDYMTWRGQQ